MNIQTITASVSTKVNLGNFKSKDYFLNMTAELEPGEDPLAAAYKLHGLVSHAIQQQLVIDNNRRGAKYTEKQLVQMHGLDRFENLPKTMSLSGARSILDQTADKTGGSVIKRAKTGKVAPKPRTDVFE